LTADSQNPGDIDAQIPKLERQIRILEKKIARSEQSRTQLEDAKDRFDSLYQSTINELDEHKELLEKQNNKLENLSSKLSKYLAPQIFQSIFSSDKEISLETKRKKLTVFFSDIKDFTQITEDLQAEDLASILNEYFTEMSQIAHEHGGTIDKFIGDAMLMFFGDPETKGVKEDATACVEMAIAMQKRMRDLQLEWRGQGLENPFQLRIGINTGYCTVGNFGSEDRMDYTIIGGEVNLAARLEAHAEVGGILMAAETYSLVKDWLQAEEQEALTVKGFAKPVRTFSVEGIYNLPEQDDRLFHHEDAGVTIAINGNRVDKEKAKEALKKALVHLDE